MYTKSHSWNAFICTSSLVFSRSLTEHTESRTHAFLCTRSSVFTQHIHSSIRPSSFIHISYMCYIRACNFFASRRLTSQIVQILRCARIDCGTATVVSGRTDNFLIAFCRACATNAVIRRREFVKIRGRKGALHRVIVELVHLCVSPYDVRRQRYVFAQAL